MDELNGISFSCFVCTAQCSEEPSAATSSKIVKAWNVCYSGYFRRHIFICVLCEALCLQASPLLMLVMSRGFCISFSSSLAVFITHIRHTKKTFVEKCHFTIITEAACQKLTCQWSPSHPNISINDTAEVANPVVSRYQHLLLTCQQSTFQGKWFLLFGF